MSREIEFRGQGANSKDWYYGSLIEKPDVKLIGYHDTYITTHRIPEFDSGWFEVPVKPNSVGQYTGWKDKNGNKIYDGDICSYKEGLYLISWGGMLGGFYQIMIPKHTGHFLQNQNMDRCEVVGNKTDTPELLKNGN